MHLGHTLRALMTKKVPDVPQTYTLNVLWFQEEGAQICCVSEVKASLTENVGRGFILCSTPPTQWTV